MLGIDKFAVSMSYLSSVIEFLVHICTFLNNFVYLSICRRHGCRDRFVPTSCPTVGYFTDTTSMSGAATDVSTSDASDEDSNDGVYVHISFNSMCNTACANCSYCYVLYIPMVCA